MATKTKPNPLKKAFPDGQLVQRRRPEADHFTAYGLFKGPEGMWILRTMEIQGNEILNYRDNEPDIRAIQVGKIAMALEGTEGA